MTKILFDRICCGADETLALGEELARMMESERTLPPFVALRGDLGAGKTEFVRGYARFASPASTVKSPTYALVNEYKKGVRPLFHFDIYRLADEDDLYSTGYFDYLDRGVCLVEWFESIPESLPPSYILVDISKIDDDSARHITITVKSEEAL